MYKEIIELHNYCRSLGIECSLEKLFDGYKLNLPKGGDIIQHQYSYGAHLGYLEPAIGSKKDYSPITLKGAKTMVRKRYYKKNKSEGA